MYRPTQMIAFLATAVIAGSVHAQAICGDLDSDGDSDASDALILRSSIAGVAQMTSA